MKAKLHRGFIFLCMAPMLMIIAGCAPRRMPFPPADARSTSSSLKPTQVPMFVCFGVDDNSISGLDVSGRQGGLHFLTELFASYKNPAGHGHPGTFDGTTIHYSFYVNTCYITEPGLDNPVYVKRAWKEAVDNGHEIGLHTHSHEHGSKFSCQAWLHQIDLNIDYLTRPFDSAEGPEKPDITKGIGVSAAQLIGFRTPFVEYNDNVFKALAKKKLQYDCSLDEGFESDQDGRNNYWPYALDKGSPGNFLLAKQNQAPLVGIYPGLWEIPVYAFIVPPDDLCEKYGVPSGLREKLARVQNDFNPAEGKITGFDWNLWYEYAMNKAEFIATLKYSFDQHFHGNRCPLTVGLHADIYSGAEPASNATPLEMREAVKEFLDYVMRESDVRVVSARELLEWLREPKPLAE